MHGRNEHLMTWIRKKQNYRFNFNCAQVCEKLFIYRNFPDAKVIILYSKIGPLYLVNLISSR